MSPYLATHRKIKFFTSSSAGSTDSTSVAESFSGTPEEHVIKDNVGDLFRLFGTNDVGVSTSTAPDYVFPNMTVDLGLNGKHGGIEFAVTGTFTGFDLVYQSYIDEGAELELFVLEDTGNPGDSRSWERVGIWPHGSTDGNYYNFGVSVDNPSGVVETKNYRIVTSNMMFYSIRTTSTDSSVLTYPTAAAPQLASMAFMGDSITRGSTLKVYTQSYAYQLAAMLGRQPYVMAYPGGGYQHEYSTTVDVVPSLIETAQKTRCAATFVQLGLNDYRNNEAASDVGDQAFQLFRTIKAHGTTLICTGVLSPEHPNSNTLANQTDVAIRRAAKAAGADLIIDTFNDGDLFNGSDSMSSIGSGYDEADTSAWAVSDDDLHMTIGGHYLMANKYYSEITSAQLPEFSDVSRIATS